MPVSIRASNIARSSALSLSSHVIRTSATPASIDGDTVGHAVRASTPADPCPRPYMQSPRCATLTWEAAAHGLL